jgi:hypothetical protein
MKLALVFMRKFELETHVSFHVVGGSLSFKENLMQ